MPTLTKLYLKFKDICECFFKTYSFDKKISFAAMITNLILVIITFCIGTRTTSIMKLQNDIIKNQRADAQRETLRLHPPQLKVTDFRIWDDDSAPLNIGKTPPDLSGARAIRSAVNLKNIGANTAHIKTGHCFLYWNPKGRSLPMLRPIFDVFKNIDPNTGEPTIYDKNNILDYEQFINMKKMPVLKIPPVDRIDPETAGLCMSTQTQIVQGKDLYLMGEVYYTDNGKALGLLEHDTPYAILFARKYNFDLQIFEKFPNEDYDYMDTPKN